MKFPFLLIVLLTVATWESSAQATGYLGKRFFVKPQVSMSFALDRPTASNQGFGENYGNADASFGLNIRPALQLGYALSRRHVLAFEAGYIKTGMLVTAYTPSVLYEDNDTHELFYHLSGVEYDLSWQIYNPLKGDLAPMGFYLGWHLKSAPMRGKIVDKKTTYAGNSSSAGHRPLNIDARYIDWAIGLEVGQHTILFDRWILALSIDMSLSPFSFYVWQTKYDYLKNNQHRFTYAASTRMQGHSMCMIKLGVGYLI